MLITEHSTDSEILAALNDNPILMDQLRAETHAAFLKARHNQSDWQALDSQHTELLTKLTLAARISESVAPNCSADKEARINAVRALLRARDRFIQQTDDGRPKLGPCVPTWLAAKRYALVFDPVMEAAFAAGEYGPQVVREGPPSFAPTQIHTRPRGHAKGIHR